MAAGDGSGDGAKPTVWEEFVTHLSDFYPYGDEPPRVCVGLNDSPTDASPDAVWTTTKKTDPSNPKNPKAPPPTKPDGLNTAGELMVPKSDVAANPKSPEAVTAVLAWVADRLQKGFLIRGLDDPWVSQVGSIQRWSPKAGPEEEWAQVVSELFVGATYFGAGWLYNMGEGTLFENGDYRNVPPSKDNEALGQAIWEGTIFSRIERTRTPRAKDPYGLKSWQDPRAFDADGSEEPNTDPAVSIATACQHCTTYVVLSRGVPLAAMGAKNQANCGVSASDASFGTPLFDPAFAYTDAYGVRWENKGGKHLPPMRDIKTAVEAGLGPGSVVVLDPSHGMGPDATLYVTPYELQKHGGTPDALWNQYLASKPSADKPPALDWDNKDRKSELETAIEKAQHDGDTDTEKKLEAQRATDKRMPVKIDSGKHYPGSHVFAVLRVHPDKDKIQCMDWNGMDTKLPAQLTESATLWDATSCIVDGSKRGSVGAVDELNRVSGIGTLPPPNQITQEQLDHLKRARPVGLVRFVITRRVVDPTMLSVDDILFVSRLLRMYGKAKDQNYTLTRLCWALRNTPGFTNVQPWWFVYAPMGIWAKAMWAQGARDASVADIVRAHGAPDGSTLRLLNVLTNTDKPGGLAVEWTRADGFNLDKNHNPTWNPRPAPLPLFLTPGLHWYPTVPQGFIPWDQSYFHKDLALHESDANFPALFRDEL